jgi:hypothetical protein
MRAKKVNEAIKWLTPRSKEEIDAYYESLPPLCKAIHKKIDEYHLNAVIEIENEDFMLVHIVDVIAAVNLGSPKWEISQPKLNEAIRHLLPRRQPIPPEEPIINDVDYDFKKYYEPSQTAIDTFNNTWQLSKYKKCYFLIDFKNNKKYWIIVEPRGELNKHLVDENHVHLDNVEDFLQKYSLN